MLRRAARRFSSSRFDAEDLLQDTLARCLRFRWTCTSENVGGWCYTVMRNEAYGRARQQRRGSFFELQDDRETPDTLADQVYIDQIIERIKLLPEDRRAMLQAAIDGASYEELGQRFGVKTNTVKTRLYRARMKLDATPFG